MEIKNVGHIAVNHHSRQRARGAAQLQVHLLHVVEVDVGIAERVDKITRLQPGHLRHHHQQQGITGNIEWHAQKQIGTALIQLQTQFAISHIKLKHCVARRQRHFVHLRHIPSAHQHAARIGVMLDLVHHLRYLVDGAAGIVGP